MMSEENKVKRYQWFNEIASGLELARQGKRQPTMMVQKTAPELMPQENLIKAIAPYIAGQYTSKELSADNKLKKGSQLLLKHLDPTLRHAWAKATETLCAAVAAPMAHPKSLLAYQKMKNDEKKEALKEAGNMIVVAVKRVERELLSVKYTVEDAIIEAGGTPRLCGKFYTPSKEDKIAMRQETQIALKHFASEIHADIEEDFWGDTIGFNQRDLR